MARKKKQGRKRADLAGPSNQPGREPSAFKNLPLGVIPSYRSTEDDLHYDGTPKSTLRDQYPLGEFGEALSNRWQPSALGYHELQAQYRPPEPRNSAVGTWDSKALPSREPPDQYRPSNTRARWEAWRPRAADVRETHPVMPVYLAGSMPADSQSPNLNLAHMSKPNRGDIHGTNLPTPSRSGTIEIRPSWQAGERERASLRAQPSFTHNNGTTSTWRPDATTPSFTPPSAIPLGVQRSPRIQPTNSFTAYQPLRSVRNTRKVTPWRIDKYYRFTHTGATRSAWAEDEEARILSQERWTASVTQRTAQYPLRIDQVETSGIVQQRRFETPQPEKSNGRRDRTLTPLPMPKPTAQYLEQVDQPPRKSATPRPLLLVIDLNGTLVDRKRRTSSFVERPNLAPFLEYVLANHTLMIWSSAQPENVRSVCQRLFSPQQQRQVLAEWGRDTLDLTRAQYKEKVQVYKRLERIWQNDRIKESHPDADRGGMWDQSNTVLIDDSRLKAAAQPHNLLEIPEFKNTPEQRGTDVLGQVVGYLEELRLQEDVSRFMRQRSFRVDDGWAAPWLEEVQVQKGRR